MYRLLLIISDGISLPKFNSAQLHPPLILHLILIMSLILGQVESQKRQFELAPSLPSHLPGPPESTKAGGAGGSHGGGSSNLILGIPNPVPPQNNPPVPLGPGGGPIGPGGGPPEPELAPFGLNHVILILVPQFKTKFRQLPPWINSNVKVALPITVSFDKLEVPPAFAGIMKPQVPALSAFLLPPPPPPGLFGMPRPRPPPGSGFGQYPYPYPHENLEEDDDLELDGDQEEASDNDNENDNDDDSDSDSNVDVDVDEHENGDGYEHGRYEEAEKRALPMNKRRRKRNIVFEKPSLPFPPPNFQYHSRRKRAVEFNKTVHATERAVLFPKLENLLSSAGLGGKSCLLRTICEVHEAPLHHYGLLGQLFTMFFSVSRSIFAESHLPEYLQAEMKGKTGNCSEYHFDCRKTMFSWEEEEPDISSYNDIY